MALYVVGVKHPLGGGRDGFGTMQEIVSADEVRYDGKVFLFLEKTREVAWFPNENVSYVAEKGALATR